MRELDRRGVARADIARYLGKRYQHVRNVLEAERGKPIPDKPEVESPADTALATCTEVRRYCVDRDGSVRIAAELLSAIGVTPGDVLVAERVGAELTLMSGPAALRKARSLFRQIVPEGTDAVEDFLAWKRHQVDQEEEAWRRSRS